MKARGDFRALTGRPVGFILRLLDSGFLTLHLSMNQ